MYGGKLNQLRKGQIELQRASNLSSLEPLWEPEPCFGIRDLPLLPLDQQQTMIRLIL